MFRQYRVGHVHGRQASDQALDALALRIRRLALHRGYDRQQLDSPLLRRLMPTRRPAGGPAAETADLRRRLGQATLDRDTLVYLTEMVDLELDFARMRLT